MKKEVILSGFIFLSFTFLFFVPFLFNPSESISMSFQIGYSNSHYILFFILLSIFWFLILNKIKISFYKINITKSKKTSKKLIVFCFSFFVVSFLANFLFSIILIDDLLEWGEASYIFKRILSANSGNIPYIDFEYLYGPLLIYFPIFLERIFGINLNLSYIFLFNLLYLISHLILFNILKKDLEIKKSYLIIIFFIFCSFHYSFSLGIPQLYIRTILTIYLLLLLKKFVIQKKNNIYLFLQPIFFFLLWSLFPEQALVFLLASFILFFFNKNKINFSFYFFTSTILIVLISLNNQFIFSSFKSILFFSSGSRDFPVLPNIFTITFLIFFILNLIFISFNFNIIDTFKKKFLIQNHQKYLIIFFVGFLNIPLMFGRSDPGHIFIGGLGIFISTLYILEFFINHKYSKYFYSLFIIFILLIVISHLNVHYRSIAHITLVNLEKKNELLSHFIKKNNILTDIIDRSKIRSQNKASDISKFKAIGENYKSIMFIPPYRNLYYGVNYINSFMLDFKMFNSKVHYNQLLQEIKKVNSIIINKNLYCKNEDNFEQSIYNRLSLTNYKYKTKNNFNLITNDLCEYIDKNFYTVKTNNIDILEKKLNNKY